MPYVKGFVLHWYDSSNYPVSCNLDGVYITSPKFYGTCDDDADISVTGVLGVLTKGDWDNAKQVEINARKPFNSWVWDEQYQLWKPPFPRPDDAVINGGTIRYQWDEATVNWVEWVET
jgi:hypothetical protein